MYNEETHKCDVLNNDWLTSLDSERLITYGMPIAYWTSTYDSLKSEDPSRSDCPADTPYYNGVDCIDCTGDTPYFNLYTRQCQDCGNDEVYDEDQQDCVNDTQSDNVASTGALQASASLFAHQQVVHQLVPSVHV